MALPAFDRDLYYRTKRPNDYIIFSDRTRSLLKDFNDCNQIIPAYEVKSDDVRMAVTSLSLIHIFGTQTEIAKAVVEKEGDYILQVKDNQKLTKEEVQSFFCPL